MVKVLIIDDDQTICNMLTEIIDHLGYKANSVNTLIDGFNELNKCDYDVVLLDVRLPDGNGFDAIPEIRSFQNSPEVIVITAFGDPDSAETAIRSGAWDYIQKPLSPKRIMLPIKRILKYRSDLITTQKRVLSLKLDGIVGSSSKMKACIDTLMQAANSDANVLINGNTGTGKELFARAIHMNSSRSEGNFVVVDCASLPETLVESSLFGYEKGAFTGAEKHHIGLIKQADGGTLFLDEIGELPFSIQKSFLRVLQERKYRPIGSKKEEKSNFRLLAASNRDLDEMVSQNQFKDALLYRIKTIVLELPPLKDRLEDLPELIQYHIRRICSNYNME